MEQIVSKQEINNLLKEVGLETIKCQKDSYHASPIKDWNGKIMKGILAYSIGPMTMTDAHLNSLRNKINMLEDKLGSLECRYFKSSEDFEYRVKNAKYAVVIKTGKNEYTAYLFHLEHYATYHSSVNYDPGYKNGWLRLEKINYKNKS